MALLDSPRLGRLIAGARLAGGFRSQEALAKALQGIGVKTSTASIQAYERGLYPPSYEVMLGIIELCDPPGGWDFFDRAVSPVQPLRPGSRGVADYREFPRRARVSRSSDRRTRISGDRGPYLNPSFLPHELSYIAPEARAA